LNNVVIVGLVMDVMLAVVAPVHGLPARVVVMAGGVALNGIATGAYIGAGLGPGPRDGLMTGLAARGHSIRVVRTSIELTVLVTGWLLGGTVGVGTVVYALAIGPIAHVTIPRLRIPLEEPVVAGGGDPVLAGAGDPSVPGKPGVAGAGDPSVVGKPVVAGAGDPHVRP
jgi:uncharacterized membrane protein YczE